jgi:hypothetical protein
MARETGLEPATSGVTGRRSNQLSYSRKAGEDPQKPPDLEPRLVQVKVIANLLLPRPFFACRCKKGRVYRQNNVGKE